jgi:hypothetical protein
MKQIKRTHIHIKTKDVLIIRNGLAPPEIHCPNCGVEVEILTPEQAAGRGLELLSGSPDVTGYSEDTSEHIIIQEKK